MRSTENVDRGPWNMRHALATRQKEKMPEPSYVNSNRRALVAATNPDLFSVIFHLRKDQRIPFSVFRLFGRGDWTHFSAIRFGVRIPGFSNRRSLEAEISRRLKTRGTVQVYGKKHELR